MARISPPTVVGLGRTEFVALRFFEVLSADAEVESLLSAHFALMRAQSPEESCHVMTAHELRNAGARVFAGRDDAGLVVALGALKPLDGGGAELKSMHCAAAHRGRGMGRALLINLEEEARRAGYTSMWLETGSSENFAAARALYASAGFTPCPPFGEYVLDPMSLFMTRAL